MKRASTDWADAADLGGFDNPSGGGFQRTLREADKRTEMNGGGGAFPLLFRERVRVRVDAIGMAGQWSDAADLGSFDNPSGGGVNEWAANQRMGDAADLGGFDRLAAVSTNRQRISGVNR